MPAVGLEPRGFARLVGRRVAVWGRGREGRAAVALCERLGTEVLVVDDHLDALGDQDGPVALGRSEGPVLAPRRLAELGVDLVLRSPGVPCRRPELQALRAAGAEVTTLLGLWLEEHGDGPVLGVTGSKGKSTTASLAGGVLRALGLRVAVGGNIGVPASELPAPGVAVDAVVLEVSSFQAADLRASPRVGVLTLLAPDHLDWHGSYERYVADKLNLFAHRPGMAVAVNATDPAAWAATGGLPGRLGYGRPEDRFGLGAGPGGREWLLVEGRPYLPAEAAAGAARLRGRHQLLDLVGALAGVACLVDRLPEPAALEEALGRLPPLPSRLATVAEDHEVEVVDDALASNPAGTVAALQTFEDRPLVLLAGGADRQVPFESLVEVLRARRAPVEVVVLGPAGARLEAALARAGGVRTERAPDLEAALALALERARSLVAGRSDGGKAVVLFSPAAPTPPEEGSYASRSARLVAAATALGLGPPAKDLPQRHDRGSDRC